jgi:hypothetical protein
MADEPTPTQAEADVMKAAAHGLQEGDGPPTVVDVPAVMVSGSVVTSCAVGDTLTVTDGNWNGEPTSYSQSWVCNTAVVGTGSSYTTKAGDAGQSVQCAVTAANAGGSTTATTNAVAVAAAAGRA